MTDRVKIIGTEHIRPLTTYSIHMQIFNTKWPGMALITSPKAAHSLPTAAIATSSYCISLWFTIILHSPLTQFHSDSHRHSKAPPSCMFSLPVSSNRASHPQHTATNFYLSGTTTYKSVILPPDGNHLAFFRLKRSKAIDKKRLGKAPSLRKWLPNWSGNKPVCSC